MSDAQLPAVSQARPPRIITEDPIAVLDTGRFEQMQRIAQAMAASSLIPDTLRGVYEGSGNARRLVEFPLPTIIANCFLVVNQAVRWGMDPFGVAQCCSVVHGRLMYEGKLVAAVVEARLGINLDYKFGRWNPETLSVDLLPVDQLPNDESLGVVVFGQRPGDPEPVTVDGCVGAWKTDGNNSPWSRQTAWKRQLRYRGAREWARAHAPGVILGVVTDDELDEAAERRVTMAVLPEPKTLAVSSGLSRPAQKAEEPEAKDETVKEPAAAEPAEPEAKPKEATPWPEPPSDGHAEKGEKYHLVSEPPGADGKRELFLDGESFSRVTPKGGFKVYAEHPPAEAQVVPDDEEGASETPPESATEKEQPGDSDEEPAIRTNPEDRRDPAQDEAEEAERHAAAGQPEAPPDGTAGVHPAVVEAIRTYTDALKAADSWLQIKAALGALRKTAGWLEHMTEEDRRIARLHAFNTTDALVKAGKDPVRPQDDPSYFALWVLAAKPEEVMPVFAKLVGTDAYRKLSEAARTSLSEQAEAASGEV